MRPFMAGLLVGAVMALVIAWVIGEVDERRQSRTAREAHEAQICDWVEAGDRRELDALYEDKDILHPRWLRAWVIARLLQHTWDRIDKIERVFPPDTSGGQ